MLRRHKITFPIKVKPEAGFHWPWRPGRTESQHLCVVLEWAHRARGKETDRRHHAILRPTKGNFTVQSSAVFSSSSLFPVPAGVSLH
jgi:hypothetical protein